MSRYRRDKTAGGSWLFTVVTYGRQPVLCDDPVRAALRDAIVQTRLKWPFRIDAWVLLPDHLHCIWTLPEGDADFSTRWNLIKRRTSKTVRTMGLCKPYDAELMTESKRKRRELTFWQRRFWEHRIRDDRDFDHHAEYIRHNPVKHGHAQSPEQWPFTGIHHHR